MAANTKLLLDTLVTSKASSFHLLLESVEHSQALQDKFSAQEWIAKINTLINSRKDRWMGVCLLDCVIRQSNTEIFLEHCSSWLKALARILQQEKQNVSLCKYVADMVERMFSFSVQFSELSREVSTSIVPSLLTAMLNEKDMNIEISLLVIKSCIHDYPGPAGSFWRRVETLLLQVFNAENSLQTQTACSCFALLPKCGNQAGKGSDKQTASWELQWKKLLATLSNVIDELYCHCETATFRMSFPVLDFKAIPVVEPRRTETCVFRIKCLLKCLDMMLRNGFSKSVNIPVDSTLRILQRILAVNGKSVENQVSMESVLLKSSLPIIHVSVLDFLTTFIESCQMSLLTYHQSITKIFLLELSWSTADAKTAGVPQSFRKLRAAVYDCLQRWVHVTGSIGENFDAVKKLIHHIVNDIKPQVATTKLLAATAASSKTVPHGKKAKRKRVQDEVSQLTGRVELREKRREAQWEERRKRRQQWSTSSAPTEPDSEFTCALKSIILKTSNDIPAETLKEVQVFVVTQLLQCQQVAISSLVPQSSYPVPYGHPECRKLLYHVLQTLLFNHNPRNPPPIQHAVRLFSQGIQDQNLEVSKFCAEAQMICHILIHPRVAITANSLSISQQQEPADEQPSDITEANHEQENQVTMKANFVVCTNEDMPCTSPSIPETNGLQIEEQIINTLNSKEEETISQTNYSSRIRLSQEEHSRNSKNIGIRNLDGELSSFVGSRPSVDETLHDNNGISHVPESLLSTQRDDKVTDIDNSPPVKKLRTEVDNRTGSNEDNRCEINCGKDVFEDRHGEDEITNSDEDEALAEKMIASFVDSVPDSD